jgi:hypothetical protein
MARCNTDWHARTPKDACLRPWARLLFPRTSWEERHPIICHSPATPFHPTAALACTLAGRPWASGLADRWTDVVEGMEFHSLRPDRLRHTVPLPPGTRHEFPPTRHEVPPMCPQSPNDLSHHREPACDPTSSLPAHTTTPPPAPLPK